MATGRTNSIINLAKEEQSKSVNITSNGTTTVTPDEGKVLSSVKVTTSVPVKTEQTTSITINTNGTNTLTPDSGKLFSKVDITTAVPIPETQTKSVNITTNGTTTITPDSGKVLSSVEVTTSIPSTLKTLLDATRSTEYLFYRYNGTSIDKLITYDDTSNVINTGHMFENSNLTSIPLLNTSKVTDMTGMFSGCSSLVSIPALDVSNITDTDNITQIFAGCSSLEEIHMTGMKVSFSISASTKFTEAALVEILNNLATVTETQTLTMGNTNLAKLTDDDKKIATDKGWKLL